MLNPGREAFGMPKQHQRDSFEETEFVASATECTGLFPALPVDDPEAEDNMARLYAVHAPITKEEEARIRCEEGAKGRRSRP